MTIYVVSEENGPVWGVFSTREKAEAFIPPRTFLDIEVCVVDVPIIDL